jgi:phosphoglycerate dehydrogenase-like enzyme
MKIVAVEPIGITAEKAEFFKTEYTKQGIDFIYYPDRNEDPNELKKRMFDADIVIISNIPLPEDMLKCCPFLKMISVAFTGLDHIDLQYCKQNNIVVKNAAGYATTGVAELAIGLMIDIYRHITFLDPNTRNGGTRNNFLGRQIKGKTVGIVGTGAIGMETARLAKAFGANVLGWSRTEREEAKAMGIQYVSLDDLLAESDIISLHTPLTEETFHLINEEKLSLCKPNAVVINTARGNVIDMNALANVLKTGALAGAAIDVFEKEPPIPLDHPLFQAPNCIVVPHIAYATEEAFEDRIKIVIQNINLFLNNSII